MIEGVKEYATKLGKTDLYPQYFAVISQGLNVMENMNEEFATDHVNNPEFFYYEHLNDIICVDDYEEIKAQEEFMTYPAVCSLPETE